MQPTVRLSATVPLPVTVPHVGPYAVVGPYTVAAPLHPEASTERPSLPGLSSRLDSLLNWLIGSTIDGPAVRFGIASIFLVNALVALMRPADFVAMLEANIVAGSFSSSAISSLVLGAAVNDALIGVFVLFGRRRQFIYMWMAIWLFLIGGLKLTNMLF